MENLYDIFHLAGAICMILFAGAGFALIVRWWDRLVIMETQIRFIFEIENELLLKSKGQTPRVSHFPKDFFEKGEDQIVSGFPPKSTHVMINGEDLAKILNRAEARFVESRQVETVGERFKTKEDFDKMLRGEEYDGNPNLPRYENPPPPPPKIKQPTGEKRK